MKYRDFGKLGIKGSAFGLGCMRFNGAASGDSIIDEEKAISLIRRAIDGGVTYIDTAYVYLDKTSEIIVGKALQDGEVIVTNDPYNNPYFNAEVDKKTGYVTKSILVMPIANINGEFIGAYQVINKLGGDGKFNAEEDCRKLSLAAVICGLALESDVFLEESHTDKLTKLKNRMGFFNDFARKYSKVLEDPSRKLSLFISDIDKFKSVNDTYGHNTGDEVLKHVAGILQQNCQYSDGVYRWGGEEFIMIMVDTDMAACAAKADEIRKIIEANDCVTEEYTVHHTMSFGVTQFDKNLSIEGNISIADEKLYKAKESGRNRVIS